MMRALLLVAVLGLALAVGGCTGSDFDFEAEATEALIIDAGYSYDGQTVRTAQDGAVTIRLKDEANEGRVEATVTDRDGTRWHMVFDEFAGTPDRQGGGVRLDFDEHGATGNGTSELPEFHAYAAAWGTATLERDGNQVREPNTLGDRFDAHLMVVMGKVRDPNTFQVYRADGTCCYDPADPEDGGLATSAGAQVILQAKTRTGGFFLHLEFEQVTIRVA